MKPVSLKIQLNSDKALILKESDTQRILEIRLQALMSANENNRPKINLGIVLDRSGSMTGENLEYVKEAARHVLDQLQKQDQVALVVYDDTVKVLSHSINVTNGNRFELKQIISGIEAGNSTNLCDGWLSGCKEIAAAAQDGTINRTLLLTDGLANVGVTDPEILAQHAFELYKDDVSTSAFGVGYGFNEHLLEAMANKGGGNFYFIERPEAIPKIFLKEFDELVGITARKVEIKLELPPSIEWQVLGGWSTDYKKGSLKIYVGDMLTDKTLDIYLKLQIPASIKSNQLVISAKVLGQGEPGQLYEDQNNVVFQYADQKDVDAIAANKELMERFSVVELAETATEALKLERKGHRDEASRMLNQNITQNLTYISLQAAEDYQGMSTRMKLGMTEADRKRSHAESYRTRRNKEQEEK
jgi:Ca-activated chloride channel family protein